MKSIQIKMLSGEKGLYYVVGAYLLSWNARLPRQHMPNFKVQPSVIDRHMGPGRIRGNAGKSQGWWRWVGPGTCSRAMHSYMP